jgi:uncharacterized protein YecA (UPF0149 family)
MDTRTGAIYEDENAAMKAGVPEKFLKQVEPSMLNPRQLKRMKIGRNDPCPCGSGKKFKRCCLSR